MSRSIEAIVDEQVRRWELLRRKPKGVKARPVITVTGQHGAHGDELARRLASELGFDHFDREIIHRVAESAHLSERVVAAMDMKKRELLTDWLAAVASRNYLSPAEYRYHLAHVIGAIAYQGGAVILGRGAHLLLRREALRVLAVAPLEDRVRSVMQSEGLTERDARRRIEEVESDRHAFIRTHYHAEFADPTAYDVVLNTAALGLDGATAVVRAALATWRPRSNRDRPGAETRETREPRVAG
jgi:cytidylate kinase